MAELFEEVLGRELAIAVKEHVKEQLAPLRAEIVALKAEKAEHEGRIKRLEALADKSVTRLPVRGAA